MSIVCYIASLSRKQAKQQWRRQQQKTKSISINKRFVQAWIWMQRQASSTNYNDEMMSLHCWSAQRSIIICSSCSKHVHTYARMHTVSQEQVVGIFYYSMLLLYVHVSCIAYCKIIMRGWEMYISKCIMYTHNNFLRCGCSSHRRNVVGFSHVCNQ